MSQPSASSSRAWEGRRLTFDFFCLPSLRVLRLHTAVRRLNSMAWGLMSHDPTCCRFISHKCVQLYRNLALLLPTPRGLTLACPCSDGYSIYYPNGNSVGACRLNGTRQKTRAADEPSPLTSGPRKHPLARPALVPDDQPHASDQPRRRCLPAARLLDEARCSWYRLPSPSSIDVCSPFSLISARLCGVAMDPIRHM